MRTLLVLNGVVNPELFSHNHSLRTNWSKLITESDLTMSLWTDSLSAKIRFHQAGPWRARALEAGDDGHNVILLSNDFLMED